jgi:PmbA protein
MLDLAENIVKKLQMQGIDEVSVIIEERDQKQIRFSNNEVDIYKNWIDSEISLFLAKGKKTLSTTIKDFNKIDEQLSTFVKLVNQVPDNDEFYGLNSKKQTYRAHVPDLKLKELDDLAYYAKNAINGALEKDAKRVSGTIYHTFEKVYLATNYNSVYDELVNFEISVRAFNEFNAPGASVFMTADHRQLREIDPYDVGQEAGEFAGMVQNPVEGKEGKLDILFHPLCFGSLITDAMSMASAFQVDSGMSFFADKIGKKVASEKLTLYDDPTFEQGVGFRLFDDEGTATRKNTIIKDGVYKTHLHSYSTAKKFGTETTGNAGIVFPGAWQPVMQEGKESETDILANMKRGLYILNTWYTRYQDYRNGDFSTIPRDGIFYIEDGEIVESWKGIRISDNMLRILNNIDSISVDREQVKWWDTVMPSILPYVLVKDVNITKAK